MCAFLLFEEKNFANAIPTNKLELFVPKVVQKIVFFPEVKLLEI